MSTEIKIKQTKHKYVNVTIRFVESDSQRQAIIIIIPQNLASESMLPQNNKNKLDKTHVYGHQSTGLSFRQYRTGSWYAVGREMSTVFLFMLSRSAFIFCGEVGWMIICLSMSLLSLCSCVVCLHIFLNKRFQIICRIKNRIKYLFTIKLKCPVHNWVKESASHEYLFALIWVFWSVVDLTLKEEFWTFIHVTTQL